MNDITPAPSLSHDDFRLDELLRVVRRRWFIILFAGLTFGAAAWGYLRTRPAMYEAAAVLISSEGWAAGTAEGGGLASTLLKERSPLGAVPGILKTRAFRETIDSQLSTQFGRECPLEIKTEDQKMFLGVTALSTSPEYALAADNLAVARLCEMYRDIPTGIWRRARISLEERIREERDVLRKRELELIEFASARGISGSATASMAAIDKAEELGRKVVDKEMEARALSRHLTPEHPELAAKLDEIAILQSALSKMEASGNSASGRSMPSVSSSLGIEYERLTRAIRSQQFFCDQLNVQYAALLSQERGASSALILLDEPRVKRRPSKNSLWTGAAVALGIFLGLLAALFLERGRMP